MVQHPDDSWSDAMWAKLCDLSPAGVAERTGAAVDQAGSYRIKFLDTDYAVDPVARRISALPDRAAGCDAEMLRLLLHYLDRGQRIEPSGRLISPLELPSGAAFYRGPHGLPTGALAVRYGNDPEGFLRAARALGGRPTGFGDVSAELTMFPDLPVTCVVWLEDDEFPARAAFLVDSVLEYQLPLDVILALINIVVRRMHAAAES
jgi:hypothetical protein